MMLWYDDPIINYGETVNDILKESTRRETLLQLKIDRAVRR